ncbi:MULTISPECIES: hypothetical protein [unclassified Limnothrix]|nr:MULTISPECIES: hypothetical protein [unclassified Limnothrix]
MIKRSLSDRCADCSAVRLLSMWLGLSLCLVMDSGATIEPAT